MTAYRIDVCTAERIGRRVIRKEETRVDGIATMTEAKNWQRLIGEACPDALVVITAYAKPRWDD